MRLPIHLQRELARLHFYDPSQSHRAIARASGLSPNTVRSMRRALVRTTVPWSHLQGLDDDAWRAALSTQDHSIAQRKQAPNWEWVHAEMQRADATLEQLWREWRQLCPGGVAYSQFTSGYRAWTRQQRVVMRRVHRPGEKLFVDFAGRTVEIRDPNGGPSSYAQIFVAVLGHSNYTYIEALPSQTTTDWIGCHASCFAFMGGAPQWVVSDNLKAAVWRRERERIVINPAYRDCLRHYDTAPLPTGARKPKHKAKAEVGVQIAQRWALFAIRDRVFFSIAELNAELRVRTEQLNLHPFKRLPGCRRERFLAADQAALKPLPATAYELSDWRYGVRVSDDHHVEHEQRFYSVPCALAREKVDCRLTQQAIEVFHRGRRVALHLLKDKPGESSTLDDHRPVAHRRVLEGEPRALMAWASTVGPNALRMLSHHLEDRNDVTNGVRAARRMRDLARLHGDARFEEVCAYALSLNITALRSVTSILKESADKRAPMATPPAARVQGDVRGASYFGELA
jgi:transposase